VKKVVIVLSSIETAEVMERWQFDIECDTAADENT
jgi:mitotic spindle assembly checkpoint protein MAD2